MKEPRTEVYVVVTAPGDLEDAREDLARALEYLASQVRTVGWAGGTYGEEDEDGEISVAGRVVVEADVVTPELRASWRDR